MGMLPEILIFKNKFPWEIRIGTWVFSLWRNVWGIAKLFFFLIGNVQDKFSWEILIGRLLESTQGSYSRDYS